MRRIVILGGAIATLVLSASAGRVIARGDYDVPAAWRLKPVGDSDFRSMVGGNWEYIHAARPDLAMFDHPHFGFGGWLRMNDIAKIESTELMRNAWTNFPVRFSEVFASKEWTNARRALARYEETWPGAPFNIYFHGSSPPCILKRTFDTDSADFEAWRAKHPGFYAFEALDEYDSQMHGFTWKSLELVKDPALVRRYGDQYVSANDYLFPRQWADVDIEKERSFHFGCRDLWGLWTILPSLAHHMARIGLKFIYYEAEHATTASPWRWGGMYARGAARQFGVSWGWYSAMYTSSSVMRNGKSPVGTAGVRGGIDTFTYWPNPEQPHRVPHLGSSRSLLRRNVRYGFFIGGEIAQVECGGNCLYATAPDGKSWTLSPYGEDYNDVFEWYRHYDRGVVYAPIAFLTSADEHMHRQGTSTFPRKDAPSIPAFLFTLVPAHSPNVAKYIRPELGEEGCLWNSPFGEIADVICPDAGRSHAEMASCLANYKAAFLIGYHDPKKTDVAALSSYVRGGGTLFCSCEQIAEGLVRTEDAGVAFATNRVMLGKTLLDETGTVVGTFAEPYAACVAKSAAAKPLLRDERGAVVAWIADAGKGRVVTVAVRRMMPEAFQNLGDRCVKSCQWTWNHQPSLIRGERTFPIVKALLVRAQDETMPIRIAGDVQWGLNRMKTSGGCGRRMATSSKSNNQTIKQSNNSHWMLWLINNRGVKKFALEPEELDLAQTATVTVDLKDLSGAQVRDITDSNPNNAICLPVKDGRFTVRVKPGEDRRIEITRCASAMSSAGPLSESVRLVEDGSSE